MFDSHAEDCISGIDQLLVKGFHIWDGLVKGLHIRHGLVKGLHIQDVLVNCTFGMDQYLFKCRVKYVRDSGVTLSAPGFC